MTKRNKSLYLILHISPWGFSHTELRFQVKKPDPARIARGEGNCLIFKLTDGDYSPAFATALSSGEFISNYGDFDFSLDLSKIPEKKFAWNKELEKYKKKNNYG